MAPMMSHFVPLMFVITVGNPMSDVRCPCAWFAALAASGALLHGMHVGPCKPSIAS